MSYGNLTYNKNGKFEVFETFRTVSNSLAFWKCIVVLFVCALYYKLLFLMRVFGFGVIFCVYEHILKMFSYIF